MATLGLITDSTSHPAVTPIQQLLVDNGHTVVLMAEADTSVSELLSFDAILAARYPASLAAASKLLAAFDSGIPVMTGSVSGVSANVNTTNVFSSLAGITGGILVGSGQEISAYIADNDSNFFNPGVFNTVLDLYSINTFGYSFNSPIPPGVEIIAYTNDGGVIDDSVAIIRAEVNTPTLSGGVTPARFVGNGFFYGVAGFTADHENAILNMIIWLTTVPAEYEVVGTVTLDGQPYSSRVVATSVSNEPTVVGTAVSDESGNYTINTGDYNGTVLVHSIQDYGIAWVDVTALQVNQVVHPTVPNGYVYRVSTQGNTGATEPTWPASPSTQVTDGSVVYQSEILLEPTIQGYIQTAEVI